MVAGFPASLQEADDCGWVRPKAEAVGLEVRIPFGDGVDQLVDCLLGDCDYSAPDGGMDVSPGVQPWVHYLSCKASLKGKWKAGSWQIECIPGHAWIKVIPNFPAAFQDATGWIFQFPMAEAMGWISSSFQEDNGI